MSFIGRMGVSLFFAKVRQLFGISNDFPYFCKVMAEQTLKEKTARGLFWGMLNNGTMQVLNLVIGIFLGRLLTPADYGIVGVLAIFTAIAGDLQSAGFTQALINIKRPTDRDYNSVFWFNVLMSVTMYVILFLAAPLIAWYFHQPVLTDVSRFLFLAFLISSLLSSVPFALTLRLFEAVSSPQETKKKKPGSLSRIFIILLMKLIQVDFHKKRLKENNTRQIISSLV